MIDRLFEKYPPVGRLSRNTRGLTRCIIGASYQMCLVNSVQAIRIVELNMECPFCHKAAIPDKFGPATCSVCMASFLIDDRRECIFVDLSKPRIPLDGVYCSKCGLIQGHENESCYLCAESLDVAVH